MKTVEPSPNYSIRVPDDIHEQCDGEVLSLWRDGDQTALQLSSHLRESGAQVSASSRLADRIETRGGEWGLSDLTTESECEIAAGVTESDGFRWHHIYAVTPRLAVYATISHPSDQAAGNWAIEAIRSLRIA